jgi:hypothetical protein
MSLQYGDGGRGNESAPQKFVHLVGYRDPKPRAEPWVRPSVSPVKRQLRDPSVRFPSLDEFATFLHLGIGGSPGHDGHRGS